MKKKLLITLVLITCSIILFSKDIDRPTAEKIAVNFFYERCNLFVNVTNYNDLNIVESKLVDDAYYVINFQEGWVLVSANDVMVPILGYNYKGVFPSKDQQSENFKSWMQHYVDQIVFIKENNIKSTKHIAAWDKYFTDDPETIISKANLNEVEPLLTSTWHQNFPYNIYCPEDPAGPGGYTYAGCGATALVQIMYYWRYPIHGSGSHSYYCYPYGDQTADFEEATYEWDAMQNDIDFNNPWEIAEITYHAAVAINMNFGPDGSYSNVILSLNAISTYFNYDTSAVLLIRDDFVLEDWEDIIREELDISRPIRYRGRSSAGGHAIICDGYQENPNYFHFNFGWGGNANGYYTLDNLNGFNANQNLIKNIFPADPEYPYIEEGPDTLTFLSGSFTDGSGPAEDYPSGMNASWLIDPQTDQDSVTNITLSFIQFSTSAADYLRVYDGPTIGDELLGEYSGDNLPANVISSSNKMLVTFESINTNSGFLLEYEGSLPNWCSSTQEFTEPSGTITDGSNNFYYNNNTSCIYHIHHSEAVKFNLEFTEISTEENEDIISIYNGDQDLIGTFSGYDLPDIIEEETDEIFIVWSTNSIFRENGWSINYMIDGVGIKEDIRESILCIIPNPFTASTTLSYELKQPEMVFLNIYNHLGQLVYQTQENQPQGQQQLKWNAESYPDGIYYYRLHVSDQVTSGKLVKVR